MQQAIVDRMDKARDQIKTLRERSLDEIQQRRETISHKADDVVQNSHDALLAAQVSLLEATRDALSWANKQLSPLAEENDGKPLLAPAAALTNSALKYVSRGEKALQEALVSLKAGDSALLPIEGYDDMSVKKVIAAMDAGEFEQGAMLVLRAYEAEHKNRVTLLRELDARLNAPANEPA